MQHRTAMQILYSTKEGCVKSSLDKKIIPHPSLICTGCIFYTHFTYLFKGGGLNG